MPPTSTTDPLLGGIAMSVISGVLYAIGIATAQPTMFGTPSSVLGVWGVLALLTGIAAGICYMVALYRACGNFDTIAIIQYRKAQRDGLLSADVATDIEGNS